MFSLPPDASVKTLIDTVHPAVKAYATRWRLCLDAYDGDGGFLTGAYIWKFPRENPDEFTHRQEQARYHNYSATLIDYYVRKVFGSTIERETTSDTLRAWWDNVDGAGSDMTSYLRQALAKALAAGSVGLLADKTRIDPTGPARIDEKSEVFLTRYLPTTMLDWRLAQDERITAIKLLEDVPSDDLLSANSLEPRILLWDRDEWVRVTDDDVERGPHNLGLVPLETLRPFRHARYPFIGRPLLGDGGILRALYNRASEQDEVIRNQAFSVFVVTLPANGEVDVEKAKLALGSEIGTLRALFTYGGGDYKTPSMEVPQTLEQHQLFLIRELYRMAHIPFERDSRDAQSADAIRLQHEELTSLLQSVAAECQRVELALAKLYFAWTSATPEQARAAFDSADVRIVYPEVFFEADPEAELKAWMLATTAVESETFGKLVQKKIVASVAGTLDDATRDTIAAEIDAATPAPVAASPDMMRTGAEARLAAFMSQPQDAQATADQATADQAAA